MNSLFRTPAFTKSYGPPLYGHASVPFGGRGYKVPLSFQGRYEGVPVLEGSQAAAVTSNLALEKEQTYTPKPKGNYNFLSNQNISRGLMDQTPVNNETVKYTDKDQEDIIKWHFLNEIKSLRDRMENKDKTLEEVMAQARASENFQKYVESDNRLSLVNLQENNNRMIDKVFNDPALKQIISSSSKFSEERDRMITKEIVRAIRDLPEYHEALSQGSPNIRRISDIIQGIKGKINLPGIDQDFINGYFERVASDTSFINKIMNVPISVRDIPLANANNRGSTERGMRSAVTRITSSLISDQEIQRALSNDTPENRKFVQDRVGEMLKSPEFSKSIVDRINQGEIDFYNLSKNPPISSANMPIPSSIPGQMETRSTMDIMRNNIISSSVIDRFMQDMSIDKDTGSILSLPPGLRPDVALQFMQNPSMLEALSRIPNLSSAFALGSSKGSKINQNFVNSSAQAMGLSDVQNINLNRTVNSIQIPSGESDEQSATSELLSKFSTPNNRNTIENSSSNQSKAGASVSGSSFSISGNMANLLNSNPLNPNPGVANQSDERNSNVDNMPNIPSSIPREVIDAITKEQKSKENSDPSLRDEFADFKKLSESNETKEQFLTKEECMDMVKEEMEKKIQNLLKPFDPDLLSI